MFDAMCFDGANIWAGNELGSNLIKLNANTGAIIGNYSTGRIPTSICFDGVNIWVANTADGTVTKF